MRDASRKIFQLHNIVMQNTEFFKVFSRKVTTLNGRNVSEQKFIKKQTVI